MDKQLLHNIVQRDTKSWNKAIVFWDEKMDWSAINTCLELGAKEGGLSLWLALKGKEVICSDVAISKEAKELHTKYKVLDKVLYEEIDVIGIPYEDYFDLIVFKSVLGGNGKNYSFSMQEQAVNEMYKALKPGGKLLFAEYVNASILPGFLRKTLQQWSRKWHSLSLQEICLLMKKFSSLDVKTTGFLSYSGSSEPQRDALDVDEKLFNNLMPYHWHYIAYGIAEK